MNKVILMGNLTRDPETRNLQNGSTSVTNFGLAMNERWTDANTGERREKVCFVEVEAWNRQGEVIQEYFAKGSQILLEGNLEFDQWEDQPSGQKRNRLKVRLQRFEFVGSNPNGNGGNSGNRNPANDPPAPTPSDGGTGEDVPF